MNLKERAQQLKVDIPTVFIALKHQDTPWLAKGLALITLIYALSPIDLIPDFIPVIGYLDDLIILPLLIALTIKLIPPQQMALCRQQAEGLWTEGKPHPWYYAIPFVLIWALLIIFILRLFHIL